MECKTDLHKSWAHFIHSFTDWELYGTLTFKADIVPTHWDLENEWIQKQFRFHLKVLHGYTLKNSTNTIHAAWGYERHINGNPHIHYLVRMADNAAVKNPLSYVHRLSFINQMYDIQGMTRLYSTWKDERGLANVSAYVSKYCTKGGCIMIDSFEFKQKR